MESRLIHGNCLERLAELEPCSVDAVVTDPPYELGFMGKEWDGTGIANSVHMWTEVLRVLKPGGHLLSFGGTRTCHRMACAIEDAGFDIRDCLQWLYGSGFPKSHNISKAIDKKLGGVRKQVGSYSIGGNAGMSTKEKGGTYGVGVGTAPPVDVAITEADTPEAQRWAGWGTALKPAHEPIVLARKPLKGTVASNVLEHGTGGINVDGCRVGITERWPANVIMDEEAGAQLDAAAGNRPSKPFPENHAKGAVLPLNKRTAGGYSDNGGPSRYFYCAKASRKEREAGLATPLEGRANTHPTVKPVALMRYLTRLITPPGGTVLDPFCGSGTTGIACKAEGFSFIGIEQSAEYIYIATQRISNYE